MSQVTTPSSGSRSPASSHSSGRITHSDTTPSPSGGNRSPLFNPHKLSSKLALVEASESLAYAAETLSVAAKAMSKAAASLAAASGYDDRDYEYEPRESKTRKAYAPEEWITSPDWTQGLHTLPSLAATHDEEIYELDEGYVLGSTSSSKEPEVNLIHAHTTPETASFSLPPEDAVSLHQDIPGEPQTPTQDQAPAPFASTPPMPAERELSTTPVISFEAVTPNPLDWADASSVQPAIRQGTVAGKGGSTMAPSNPPTVSTPKPAIRASAAKPASNQTPSASTSTQNTSHTPPQKLTRIVLDRGFDAILALCDISKRCSKTICFYPNPGASSIHTVGIVLKAHASQSVIAPDSLKPEKLLASGRKFSSASSGVLVWPIHIALSGVTNLESPDTQVVFLGEPLKETSGVTCPRITLILAKSELASLKAKATKAITRKYALDPANNAYNDQGATSPLHTLRTWMRHRLSDMSFARSFYWGWIVHHRKQNPSWSALQLVRAANKYAEEFLLRGDTWDYGEPVGGQIPISRSDVKGQKLQPAVQAGILPVY